MLNTTPQCVDVPRWSAYEKSAAGKPSPLANALPRHEGVQGARAVQFPVRAVDTVTGRSPWIFHDRAARKPALFR